MSDFQYIFCFFFPFRCSSNDKNFQVRSGVLSDRRTKISAVNKTGLSELRVVVEKGIIASTGRQVKKLVFPPDGPQLR